MNIDPPSPYNTSLTGQFLWQVSRSREWAHPVGKVVFNSMEDGGCCCGVVGWTNAKAGATPGQSGSPQHILHQSMMEPALSQCQWPSLAS